MTSRRGREQARAEYEAGWAAAVEAGEERWREARTASVKAREELRRVVGQARARDAEHRQQAAQDAQRIAYLEGQVQSATAQGNRLLDLVTKLTADLARSPEVLTESMLTGIAAIYNPPYSPQPAAEQANVKQTNIGKQDEDLPGMFFPDVEFDESMESPQSWPTPGTMMDPTNPPPSPMPETIPNGYPRAGTGPMFQSGTSGNPPVGGVE